VVCVAEIARRVMDFVGRFRVMESPKILESGRCGMMPKLPVCLPF
jgi:hypothetical protein